MATTNLTYKKIKCTGQNLAQLADKTNRRIAVGQANRAWELIKEKLIEAAHNGNYRLLLSRDEKRFECFYDTEPNFSLERLKEITNEAGLKLLVVQPETFSQIEIWLSFDEYKGRSAGQTEEEE